MFNNVTDLFSVKIIHKKNKLSICDGQVATNEMSRNMYEEIINLVRFKNRPFTGRFGVKFCKFNGESENT